VGTWLSSELGKVKGSVEEEWCPTSVTPLQEQVCSLTATSLMVLRAMGQPLLLPYLENKTE